MREPTHPPKGTTKPDPPPAPPARSSSSPVDRLAEIVGTFIAQATERDANIEARLELLERGLEGQAKIGTKLGALASAMDRNLGVVEETRKAMVDRQNEAAARVETALGVNLPPIADVRDINPITGVRRDIDEEREG